MTILPFHAIPYPFFSNVEFKVSVGVLWELSVSDGLVPNCRRAIAVSLGAHWRTQLRDVVRSKSADIVFVDRAFQHEVRPGS